MTKENFMKSRMFRLNLQDLGHGFIMAVGVVFIAPLLPILQTGAFPDTATIKASLAAGLAAGIVYLTKNLISNSQGIIGGAETNYKRIEG
jgi:hypothetical protein